MSASERDPVIVGWVGSKYNSTRFFFFKKDEASLATPHTHEFPQISQIDLYHWTTDKRFEWKKRSNNKQVQRVKS